MPTASTKAAAPTAADPPSADRGRDAERPGEIPAAGWRDIAMRVRRRIVDDRLSLVAAGVAFWAVLATFPALLALLSLFGIAFDPAQVPARLAPLRADLSPDALQLLTALLQGLADPRTHRLGLSLGGGLLFALWGASLAIRMLMEALNVAYGEDEKRSFAVRISLALLITAGAMGVAAILAGGVVVTPAALRIVDVSGLPRGLLVYARWPVVTLLFWLSLLVMYRYGPSRAHARWSWVSWGAFIATALWLCGSMLLSWYVSGFGAYDKAYGSVGLVVIVLVWYLLSAFAVLVGAEVNAELERQTRADTTVGAERPLGRRGASAADTVGDAAR